MAAANKILSHDFLLFLYRIRREDESKEVNRLYNRLHTDKNLIEKLLNSLKRFNGAYQTKKEISNLTKLNNREIFILLDIASIPYKDDKDIG